MTEINNQSNSTNGLPYWKAQFIRMKDRNELDQIKTTAVFYKNAAVAYKEGSFAHKEFNNLYLFGKQIYQELKQSMN